MKKKLAFLGASAVTLLSPLAVFAQTVCVGSARYGTVDAVICRIYDIIKIVIPVLIIGAVAYFIGVS